MFHNAMTMLFHYYTVIFHDLKKTPILILNNNELMSLEFNSWWFTENTFFFAYYSYTMSNTKLYICRTCIPCIANSMIFLRATRIAQNHIQYIHTTTCQTEKNFFEFKVIKSWLICDESWNKIAELASSEQ